jgi:ABC-type hemin transport system ATPase subunit
MLIATHDLDLVIKLLPRTVLMHQGRIVADGLTQQVLKDETLLQAYGL